MPRRAKKAIKRITHPDAKYESVIVAKFINKVMVRGQKATAERVVYDALQKVGERLNTNSGEALEHAIKNVTPLLQVKPRRVGGATYQVPVEVPPDHARHLAMRWLITSARSRNDKSMAEKLAAEIIDAAQGQGGAMKKRDEVHKMAEANRAFVHFRW